MKQLVQRGGFVILATFMMACILSIIPMSDSLSNWRPEWVSLVLIFWCMTVPHRIGVFSGWSAGIFLDILYGTLLGQYALALSVVAFLSYRLQTRLRLFPVLQQSLIVLLLIALQQMLVLWIKGIAGNTPITFSYWLPSISSTLIWPLVAFLLDRLRALFHIV